MVRDPVSLGLLTEISDPCCVAERRHAADQRPLRLKRRFLSRMRREVTSPRIGQTTAARFTSVGPSRWCVELLGDRATVHTMLSNSSDEFGEVRQAAGQAVDL